MAGEPAGNQPSSPEYGPEQLKESEGAAVGRNPSPNSTGTSPGKVNYGTGKPKDSQPDDLATSTAGGKSNYDSSGNVSEPEKSLYNSSSTAAGGSRLKGMFSTRRKKAAWGGGAAGIVGILIVGFIAVVPAELIHFAEDALAYESRIEQHFEQKASKKILAKIGDKIAERAKNKAAADAKEAADKAAGKQLAANLDDFPGQALVDELNKQGFDAKIGANGLEIKSPTNEPIDLANMSDEDFATMQSALPDWAAGQLDDYRSVMLENSGVTMAGIPNEPGEDAIKDMESDVEKGATGDDFIAESEEIDNQGGGTTDQTQAEAQAQAAANAAEAEQAGAGSLTNAVNAEEAEFAKTGDTTKSIAAGEEAFDAGGDPLLATYIVTTGCTVDQSVTKASNQRVPLITKLLIRHGNLLLTLASELRAGGLTTNTLSQVMNLLNGNPSAGNDPKTGKPSEATLPASSSAAYQRVTGGAWNTDPNSDNYTPDINKGDLPSINSGTKIVNEINAIVDKFGGNYACKALTGFWGTVTQVVAGGVQLVTDIGSLGTAQAAIIGANLAFQIDLNFFVLPDVLTYFSNIGITGAEDAVQWFSNSDAGLDLSFNDYGRSIGAAPLTTAQAITLGNEGTQDQIAQEMRKPLTTRLFALNDPKSLVSRAVDHVPTSPYAMMSSLGGYFTNIGSELENTFSIILNPHRALAAAPATADPYGVTQYAFTDAENEKYDPIDNENYLFDDITVAGKQIRRIDALGNPNTYVPSPDGDSNDADILHCFVDPYGLYVAGGVHGLADNSLDPNPAQKYCGSIGSYDYSADAPTLPTATDIADAYCSYALTETSPDGDGVSGCAPALTAQITAGDDLGHFRQYLLDTHIVNDYETLLNAQ